ncbi:restriction endonuclease subunit S [Mitsuokella jalaludinii]|uniref:restriction endonuclease subunit S n=1 Tax=Mitsuokella jalaludinii TaxID=187979 RepID=UPI003CFE675B
MNAQDLKNSILQRAIEGKLVPQRKEEGTAKELLAEIRAEKARLVKEKKIKKSKPLPEITDEEKPFDIPESWEWVRIGELFSLQAGKNIKATYIYHEQTESHVYPCYGGNGVRGFVEFFNSEGDFPIIGRQGALCGNINRAKGKFYATEHAVLTTTFANTDVSWACYFLKALNLNQYATATAQPGLAVSKINQVLIPLPPLAEQHRIVAKIEELQPDINAYDKAQTKLRTIEQRFPDDMKKSLLQYAIEGKLVPQRKEEGTAKDLLAAIRAEKAQLIKEKKIKKPQPLPAITDDEKPFDIPESWEWVRLAEVGTIIGGGTPKTQILEYWDGDIPWLTPADMKFIGKYAMSGNRNISLLGLQKSSARLMPKGTVLFSSRAPIGYIAIAKNKICTNQGFKSVVPFTMPCNEYIYYCLQARIKDIQLRASGTTFKEISGSEFGKTMIPLPPLAEQHRIVAKLEELLPLCQQLAHHS